MKVHLIKMLKFFYKPYTSLLLGISICGIFFVLFESFAVVTVFPIISTMMGQGGLPATSSVLRFTQNVIQAIPIADKFIAVFSLYLVINIFVNIFQYLYETMAEVSSYIVMRDFQKKIYEKIILSDYQYFLDNKQGELMYRMITAPGQMIRIFLALPRFAVEGLKFIFIIVVLFMISVKLTIWVLIVGFLAYCFNSFLAKKISYNTGRGRVLASGEQNVLATEAVSGIRQLKVFLASQHWIRRFSEVSGAFAKFATKDSLFLPVPRSALSIIVISIICISAIFAKMKMGENFVSFLPLIGVYLYAFFKIIPSISSFGQMHMRFMGGLPYAEVVYNELHTKSRYIDDGEKILKSFEHSVCFDRLYFTYPKREGTLKDINIAFEKSKITAIVGPSGSGKSTIVDLMLRLYKPTGGRILIDGIDLSELKISSWLDKIGFVSQDTFVFNATITDNIAFSFRSTQRDLKGVIEAAKIANAHAFISTLPEGYNTIVGDRGLKLSGGERQRIAIARAIYRKPRILIFDEATSSLDSKAENIVQDAIDAISRNHSVIVISHRLSTILNAHKIIVIDNGVIVDEGNHKTLMEKKGLYWRLYSEQVVLPALDPK